MGNTEIPPSARIADSYVELSHASSELQAAARELSDSIAALESALQVLNLGVSAWHEIASSQDDNLNYWTRALGYAKVGNEWGIAIRRTWGNEGFDDHNQEIWRFSEAPRWMCIESSGKLPELFDDLIARTKDATSKLKARTEETKELVAAVAAFAPEAPKKRRRGH